MLNGNQDPLYFVAKSSCTAYSGACRSDAYPKYCAILASYDCSRTSNGLTYQTTTKKTTTTTTTTTTKNQIVQTILNQIQLPHKQLPRLQQQL